MIIWILESSSGLKLLHKSFMDIVDNESLISGLLSAFHQFTKTEFNQTIESIEMAGLRWIYIINEEDDLLLIGATPKNVSSDLLRGRLNIINDAFITDHGEEWRNRGENWAVDTTNYEIFLDKVIQFYFQWEEAEIMIGLANFFDLIGVFQQILNILKKIIKDYIKNETVQEEIHLRLEKFFEEFRNRQDIKFDNELKKITYSKESGFKIININPASCDPYFVKVQLLQIIIEVTNVIIKVEGKDLSMNQFREAKVFNYIFRNKQFLQDLNLFDFLLKLFLEI